MDHHPNKDDGKNRRRRSALESIQNVNGQTNQLISLICLLIISSKLVTNAQQLPRFIQMPANVATQPSRQLLSGYESPVAIQQQQQQQVDQPLQVAPAAATLSRSRMARQQSASPVMMIATGPPAPPVVPNAQLPTTTTTTTMARQWRNSTNYNHQLYQYREYPIILPSDQYRGNLSQDIQSSSYVIDRKRFIEAVSSRCLATTILKEPKMLEPTFILVTRGYERRLNATVQAQTIYGAGFDPTKATKILIHGFTQSYPTTEWLRKARALFEINNSPKVYPYNLFIMDWGTAAGGSYSEAAASVSGMGSFLANFIMKLTDQLGANRMSIHLIGHSLGAHLAGFAGKRINPQIGRITALDAAGPCFGKILSNSPNDRLSPEDAYEVDAYHYDDDFLGLPGQHGQFDVYVNGGSSQPGCSDNFNTAFQAALTITFRRNRVLSESHTRSTEVATVQLKSITNCQQVAYECRDYKSFLSGECGKCDDSNNQCFLMGFNFQYNDMKHEPELRTSFPGKKFYITTGSVESTFCLNQYQLLVKFEPNPEMAQAAKYYKWRLQLDLLTDQNERFNATITNQLAPHIFSYLLQIETRPMRIKAAQLQVRAKDGSIIQLQPSKSPFKVYAIDVNFMSNYDPKLRQAISSRLCPSIPIKDPPQQVDSTNLILDSSASAGNSGWLQFNECTMPPADNTYY